MALLLKRCYLFYNWAMHDVSDTRTNDLPLVKSIFYPLTIIGIYIYFVLHFGPRLMKNRKPFDLNKLLIVYNALQVAYCTIIVYEASRTVLFKYDWRCAPVDYANTKEAKYVTRLVWSYYMIKIADLLDTVFFVLRKKSNQVTFLHVYHHAGMVMMTWGATKFFPGGHCIYLGVINCFVHAVMYIYYLLTAYDSEYKNSIWWKKHITQLQLMQFTFFSLIYGQILFRPDCQFPRWTQIVFLPQNAFMMMLFGDFYYKTYIKTKPAIIAE
ncbi:PREDICTED: elongation of very long chain fatty acids protein AAEL008004-like [Nicrophorus vespilloides]|uniref:Elongation of very long chain fatty acids protein n=1 Tax=Nicrophorus vespilloides TaxID=110193 RepID=A0ABM1MRH5_NICVS|nr:PREDICTED: elongation of very long chain fatty acids protein AAEL008004-like [Nicrophorus vespilloides]